jgi:hypothetical protein
MICIRWGAVEMADTYPDAQRIVGQVAAKRRDTAYAYHNMDVEEKKQSGMLRGDPDRSHQAALQLDKMVYQAPHTHTHTHTHTHIYMCVCIYIYMYIYRESARERERKRERESRSPEF